ncbi:hypothetical protein ACCC13_001765 [Yersinia enterocolitica]
MTIIRGQEGTVSRLWSANDIAANMMTAGTLDLFAQSVSLGGAASLNVGTAAGTVAAGNDNRITGALQKSANLSDLQSTSTARTNLGLGGAAVLNVGTTVGTVAAGDDIRIVNAISSKNTNVSLPGALTTVSDSRAARFLSKSDVVAGEDRAEGHATLAVDGNVHGTVWGGALSTYINNLRNTASMGTNGWHRDATTGLIMQWVKGAPSSGSDETIVNLYFPIVFPSICLFASAGTLGTGSSSENKMFQTITWARDFVQLKPQDMASSGGTVYPLVFAIGY